MSFKHLSKAAALQASSTTPASTTASTDHDKAGKTKSDKGALKKVILAGPDVTLPAC